MPVAICLNAMRNFRLTTVTCLLSATLLCAGFCVSPRAAAETIGISIPLSGDAAELGQNFRTGMKLAMEDLGMSSDLFIADDGCDPDLAALAAGDLKDRSPDIVIGMVCNEPAKVIASSLVDSKIPVLVAGARSMRLIKDREREEWNLWRLSPGDDYPVSVAADAIAAIWQETPYAIVDDGTIYGRSFSDLLRGQMQEKGLAPQFSDTFRAAQSSQAGLLRRLKRSGVTAAFVASATLEDLFTIARNMKEFNLKLDLMTTEALELLPYLEDASLAPEGIRVITAPLAVSEKLSNRLEAAGLVPERQILNGYATMQIVNQAIGKTPEETNRNLKTKTFDTVLGMITFSENGNSSYNPYKMLIWNGSKLIEPNNTGATQ